MPEKTLPPNSRRPRRGAAAIWVPIALVVLAGLAIVLWRSRGTVVDTDVTSTYAIARETLRISVIESGTPTICWSLDNGCCWSLARASGSSRFP